MTLSLVDRLRLLADQAAADAQRMPEARDADYYTGLARAFREAAQLVEAEADNGS